MVKDLYSPYLSYESLMYEVIESIEHDWVVKDMVPCEITVNKVLTNKTLEYIHYSKCICQ